MQNVVTASALTMGIPIDRVGGGKILRNCPIGERGGGITHKNGISNRVYQTISNEIKEIKQ